MGAKQLRRGLWLRMGVAAVVWLCLLAVVLAIELAAASLAVLLVIVAGPVYGLFLLGVALVIAVITTLWRLLVRVLGLTEQSPAEQTETDEQEETNSRPRERLGQNGYGQAAAVAGIGLVLVTFGPFVEYVVQIEEFTASVIGGTVLVAVYTGWLVYNELQEASIRSEIADEYATISAPAYEQEVEKRLTRLAKQADIAVPDVEVGASYLPQAGTVGYRPSESTVFVTRGFVDSLDDRELDAALAHELAHLLNRDGALLTGLSVPQAKAVGLIRLHIPGMVVGAVVYSISRLSVPFVARYREYVADHAAAALTGDPAAVAGALATLQAEHNVWHVGDGRRHWSAAAFGIVPPPWETRKFFDGTARFFKRRVLGTHPPTERRIERLREQIE